MDGVDIFSLITGIISILSVPVGVAAIIYNLLPCTRLRELEQIFTETEDLLHKNAEAGLLGPQRTASGFRGRLEALRASLEDVRVESHCATTYAQNFKKMLAGLSRRIFSLCGQVKKLRADISTTSARERERLRQTNPSATGEAGSGASEQSLSCAPPVEHGTSTSATSSAPPVQPHSSSDGHSQHPHDPEACGMLVPHTISLPSSNLEGTKSSGSAINAYTSRDSLDSPSSSSLSSSSAVAEGDQNDAVVCPRQVPEDGLNFSPARTRSIASHSKRHRCSAPRTRMFSHLLRGKPSRRHSSSSSTCGLILGPSRTLASIEVVPDGDDVEWEDLPHE